MIRKDLIIAILATFCLTATLLLIIPTRSQTANQYDPWVDVNGDGKIDGKDIALPALAFGTAGDPTRIVEPATSSGRYTLNIPLHGNYYVFPPVETKGYNRIFFNIKSDPRYFYECNLTVGWITQGTFNTSLPWRNQIDHLEEFENAIYQSSTGDNSTSWTESNIKGETLVMWIGDTNANSYELSYYMTA